MSKLESGYVDDRDLMGSEDEFVIVQAAVIRCPDREWQG